MSSGPAIPFRVFKSSQFPNKADPFTFAIGRAHSSWFLIYARPVGIRMKRISLCLNHIVPGDPTTVSAPSSSEEKKLRFTVGGGHGPIVVDALLALQDDQGRPAVRVVRRFTGLAPLQAIVEIDIPDAELAYACARCGMWETMNGPRFMRCGGCKSRYYCSTGCQRNDWKQAFHKGECALLKEGKAHEAESRRRLHNNDWWMQSLQTESNPLTEEALQAQYKRAMDEVDCVYLAYGQRMLPRDVPPDTRPPPPPTSSNGLPPGFVPTGSSTTDEYLISRYRMDQRWPEFQWPPGPR